MEFWPLKKGEPNGIWDVMRVNINNVGHWIMKDEPDRVAA
jgi:hypothetical protein